MLVEPRAPGGADRVSRLDDGIEPRAEGAAQHAEMAAVLARHQFEDATGLPEPLHPEHDAFLRPLHNVSTNSPSLSYCRHRAAAKRRDPVIPLKRDGAS